MYSFIYLFIGLFIYLSIYLFIYLFLHYIIVTFIFICHSSLTILIPYGVKFLGLIRVVFLIESSLTKACTYMISLTGTDLKQSPIKFSGIDKWG